MTVLSQLHVESIMYCVGICHPGSPPLWSSTQLHGTLELFGLLHVQHKYMYRYKGAKLELQVGSLLWNPEWKYCVNRTQR